MKVLKKFKISIFYIVFLIVINFFHPRVEDFLINLTGKKFILYLIYALFVSFSLVLLFKIIPSKKNPELALVLLTMGFVFYLLVSRGHFLSKLNIPEFFILGILVSIENKKSRFFSPFILLFAAVFLVEVAHNLSIGSRFYYLDVWINSLTGLSGYIAGFLLI